jgi:hypothetical protein
MCLVHQRSTLTCRPQVSEDTWLVVREQGAIIEEADSDTDDELEEKVDTVDSITTPLIVDSASEGVQRWFPEGTPDDLLP